MHMHNAYDDSHSSLPTTPASHTFLPPESLIVHEGFGAKFWNLLSSGYTIKDSDSCSLSMLLKGLVLQEISTKTTAAWS